MFTEEDQYKPTVADTHIKWQPFSDVEMVWFADRKKLVAWGLAPSPALEA